MTSFPNLPCSIFPLIFRRTEQFPVIICNDIDFLLTVVLYIFAKGVSLCHLSHIWSVLHTKDSSVMHMFLELEIAQHSFVC